jgi:hypothetical protein
MPAYLQRKYLEWRSVFLEFRAMVKHLGRWGELSWSERAVGILAVILCGWTVVLPAILVPAGILFLLWVILFL